MHDNARKPLSWVAKKTGLTREIVQYNLKKLEDHNIVTGYLARVDQAIICQGVGSLQLTLLRMNDERHAEIIQYFYDHHRVNWFGEVCGTADILVTLLYQDLEELEDTITEITQFIGPNLKKHQMDLYLEEYKFTRKGLIYERAETQKKQFSFAEHKKIELDGLNKNILIHLAQNCRVSNAALARKLHVTEDLVRLRIKKLEKKGIIQGYVLTLNCTGLGKESYYLFLTLEHMTRDTVEKIKSYANNNPYIIFCTRTIGTHNILIAMYVNDRKHFQEELSALRKEFSEQLTDYKFHLGIKEYKETYLTEQYFQ